MVPCDLLWQVLETVGIHGPILDCIKSLYSHDSAAVRNQEGISDIFDCLMGVKQGCPLSASLFRLFVDGLEQHLMDTLGHNAPFLEDSAWQIEWVNQDSNTSLPFDLRLRQASEHAAAEV